MLRRPFDRPLEVVEKETPAPIAIQLVDGTALDIMFPFMTAPITILLETHVDTYDISNDGMQIRVTRGDGETVRYNVDKAYWYSLRAMKLRKAEPKYVPGSINTPMASPDAPSQPAM